jgi:leader peptidase (prepilin peptidase)/N-methyltransferase
MSALLTALLGFPAGLLLHALAGVLCTRPGGAGTRWSRAAAAVATAGLWALVVLTARDGVQTVLGLLLASALVPVVLVDVAERRIPNAVTGPAAVAALVLGTTLDPGGAPARLAAAAGATAFLLVPALLRPAGMGMGDVKLAGVLGLCLGPPVAVALLGALLAGTLAGAGVALRSGLGRARRATLPFGPCLALGAAGALAAGPQVLHGYMALL